MGTGGGLSLQEFLRCLRWCIDLAIDKQPAGISTTGAFEFPSDIVSFTSELAPFRMLRRVLLKPKMILRIRKRTKI